MATVCSTLFTACVSFAPVNGRGVADVEGAGMVDEFDPNDRLRLSPAGEWATEKHRCLGEYIDSAWGARAKFAGHGGRCGYVDVFSGPGRQYVEGTSEIINGSPLVAWAASTLHGALFADVLISDKRSYVTACETRLKALDAPVTIAALNAVECSAVAAKRLDPKGLHLAFVDPYGLIQLDWRIFEPLVTLPHIDFIVHFSAAGLARNLDRHIKSDPSPLDHVAPGWRSAVKPGSKAEMRSQFFNHWVARFSPYGFKLARSVPLFVNDTKAPLYRLALLSRHDLAAKLWNSVTRDQLQPQLSFS